MLIEEWEKQSSEDVVGWCERWKIAFSRAFQRADGTFRNRTFDAHFAGSTASVVVLSPCQIIASNCGDSRAILCRGKEVTPLTVDHKPHKKEVKRVEGRGGKIHKGNVSGVEGDHDLKQFIISMPDVTFTQRSEEDECLILACDGLWDVMSNEKVAKLARKKLQAYRARITSDSTLIPAASVAKDLVCKALGKGSKDNITVTIVDLKTQWKSSKKKLQKQRSDREMN